MCLACFFSLSVGWGLRPSRECSFFTIIYISLLQSNPSNKFYFSLLCPNFVLSYGSEMVSSISACLAWRYCNRWIRSFFLTSGWSLSTEHCCVLKFRAWGFEVHWDTVWSNLHLWRFIRPVRDTNWLIAKHLIAWYQMLVSHM